MPSTERLTAAAEELVKAAYLDVKTEGESKAAKETVAAIQLGNAHLSSLEKQVFSAKDSMDAKVNTLNQNVDNLKVQMEEVKKSIANQSKLQNLSWAIEHCKTNEFTYQDTNGTISKSGDLVRLILFSFRTEVGRFIPSNAFIGGDSYNYRHKDEATKKKWTLEFRTKLINQIHELTGQKSRIDARTDGTFAIYYS